MRRTTYCLSLLFIGLPFVAACARGDTASQDKAAEAAHTEVAWSYAGETGPDRWGMLSEEYAACAAGMAQSPIDVATASVESHDLPPLEFDYGNTTVRVETSGYGMVVTPETTQRLTIGEDQYTLLQFHPHGPSEHTIDGQSFPLEIHFVHQNDAGQLAVVGVMFEEGASSAAYEAIAGAGREGGATMEVNLAELLPDAAGYITYDGSLTTPPCSEGVRWNLLTESMSLSSDQLAALAGDHGPTNRPVQPLSGRTVRSSR